jgi:hypothetical protein
MKIGHHASKHFIAFVHKVVVEGLKAKHRVEGWLREVLVAVSTDTSTQTLLKRGARMKVITENQITIIQEWQVLLKYLIWSLFDGVSSFYFSTLLLCPLNVELG